MSGLRMNAPEAAPFSRAQRTLVESSFTHRATSLAVLERHRALMRSAEALLERARPLCAGGAPAPPPLRAADPHVAAGEPMERAWRCAVPGCARPAAFRPCFFVEWGARRVLVRDLPYATCREHRANLTDLFARPSVMESLREKLRARGRGGPGHVRVLYEVEGGAAPEEPVAPAGARR